jgi:RHS repeat-associated protein
MNKPLISRKIIAKPIRTITTWIVTVAVTVSQIQFVPTAEAADPGTSTLSAGTAPPPAATTVESFQPDLFTGRATTSLPMPVPPGRKGVQPNLALSYASSGPNGWVGVGWGFDLGFIERSTRAGQPSYTDADTFAFMMQGVSSDLVKLGDGTYRAEMEGGFMRLEYLGPTAGWEVRDKSGTRFFFGQSVNSRVEEGGKIPRWCLDKVMDVNGNTMDIIYAKHGGQPHPVQIDYTGHSGGLAPANRVTFTWEDRPDIGQGYRYGLDSVLSTPKRLKRVETYATVDGSLSLATRYELNYRLSERTGRSLLSGFTKIGSDGVTAMPSTAFTYQEADAPAYSTTFKAGSGGQVAWNVRVLNRSYQHDNYGPISPYHGIPYGSPVVVTQGTRNVDGIDVTVGSNGSIQVPGRQDFYVHAWTCVFADTDRTVSFTKWGTWDVASLWIEDGTGLRGPFTSPANISIKAGWSFVHLVGYNENQGFSMGVSSALTSMFTLISPSVFNEPQMAGDVDGNGFSDLISYENGTWKVSLSQGPMLLPPQTFLSGFGSNTHIPMIGDWNADGRTDVAIYKDGAWRFATSTGTNFISDTIGTMTFGNGTPLTGDFNGDGITDLASYKDGAWAVALGSRTNFAAASTFNLQMSEGEPVMAPHDVRWTVRGWPRDCMHETRGCMFPGGRTPTCNESPAWTVSTVAGGTSKTVGGVTFTVGSTGALSVSHPQDRYWWAEVSVYAKTARTISMGKSGTWDIACLYSEAPDGTITARQPTSIPLAVGWNKVHFTGYHEHQGVSAGITGNLMSQVDIMSPTRIEANITTARHMTGDFNGDGLTDIAVVKDGQVYIAYSNGKGFVRQAPWILPFGSNEYVTGDFNGDGLTDIGYYDRSTGKLRVSFSKIGDFTTPVDLPFTLALRSQNDKIQLAELNGDGLPDVAVFNSITGDSELAVSSGTAADLLKRINNPLGGSSELKYQSSTAMNNTFLPIVLPVVVETSLDNGLGHVMATTYSYSQGLYDSASREFRGFGHVRVRDAEQTVSATDFHQDAQRKGRPYHAAVYDSGSNLWTKTETTWVSTEAYPGSGAYFTRLAQLDGYTYDGNATYRQMRIQYGYDGYGNITNIYEAGDVSDPGDDRSTARTYALNTSAWILNKPATVKNYDSQNRLVAQERFFYDGAAALGAPPSKGNATKVENWLNLPAERWVSASSTFDVYGNVVSVTDPRGNSIVNEYDTTSYTYITSVRNPLGHVRTTAFDPRYGSLLWTVSENGVRDFRQYDALNRHVATGYVDPVSGANHVFEEIAYDTTSFPRRLIKTAYMAPDKQQPHVAYEFTDGLGRTIQKRSPAESAGQQIVSGTVELDSLGRVGKAWVNYFETASTSYNPTTPVELPPTTYRYDVLGRLLEIRGPDGNASFVAYDDWSSIGTDANGNQVKIVTDAYKRTVRVEEQLGGQTLVTTYEHDSRDRTTLIRDAQGNETKTEYDSLGRRVRSVDPNLGTWTYTYDDTGNLLSYQDARGVVTTHTYDLLGRLVRRESAPPAGSGIEYAGAVSFTYDAGAYGKGKQTGMTDPTGSVTMQFDYKDRLVSDTKTIDGVAHTITRSYDFHNRLVSATYPGGDAVDYTYNNQGGIKTVKYRPAAGGLITLVSDMQYNALGMVTRVVYGNGTSTDYSRNPLSLKPERTVTYAGGVAIQDLNYQFDPAGNLVGLVDAARSTAQTFAYDQLNRLTGATGPYGALAYGYDAIGNMTSKEGLSMSYGAGSAGPHAVTSRGDGLTLSYDANGNMTVKNNPAAGVRQDFSYDVLNRLVRVTNTVTAAGSVQLQPGWNMVSFPQAGNGMSVGTVLPQFGTKYNQLTAATPTNDIFKSYAGEAEFDQFATVNASEGYWLWVTDPAGATLSWANGPGMSVSKSLKTGWQLLPGPAKAMTTAAWMNNLQAGVDYGEIKTYSGSAFANATSVEPGRAYMVQILRDTTWTPPAAMVGGETRFVYDGAGARIKKITAAGTTTFVGAACEIRPDGQRVVNVFAGGRRVAAVYPNAQWYIYHPDHLGTPSLVTDSSGQVVERSEFTPFGSLSYRAGTFNAPQKFTGQLFDAEIGLYYFNARYYDPDLGRFLSPDTVQQDPADPQALNRYSYVRNNPLVFADPSGHLFWAIIGAIALGAFGGAVMGVVMAAVTGGDIGAAAWRGALAGAVSGPFSYLGSTWFAGTTIWDFAGSGLMTALGSAAGAAAVAAVTGEDVGKSALSAFQTSLIVYVGNYAVGKVSGWSAADHDRSLEVNTDKHPDGRLPSGDKVSVRVGGQSESHGRAVDMMKAGKHDAMVYNPTRGGFLDTVESAQSLLFGPGMFARGLARELDTIAAQGAVASIFTHSQGTIMGGQALTLMRQDHSTWNIYYSRAAMFEPSAYAYAWDSGVKVTGYAQHPFDIVSALGNPLLMITAIPYLPLYIFGGEKFGAAAVHCGTASYQ